MDNSEEEKLDEDDVEIKDEFNADELDLKELESEVSPEELESLTGKVPPFLARLQWWGFGILLLFIVLVIIRMIFGPPWIDRFLNQRLPVAMDANKSRVGVILPIVDKSKGFIYKLIFSDYRGQVIHEEELGRVQAQAGPLDIALGENVYYYILGSGKWVGVRSYEQSLNYDIDLKQFDMEYRDGLNLKYSPKSWIELIEIYNDSKIIVLRQDGIFWRSVLERNTMSWETGMEIIDSCGTNSLVSNGPAFIVVSLDYLLMPQERFYVRPLQRRPLFPGEFVYKPAFLSSIPESGDGFLIVKNDRMFNLQYKYSDDQLFVKYPKESDLHVLRHQYFSGRDIRSAMFVKPEEIDRANDIDFVILYEYGNEFHLAALKLDNPQPVWDISLGQSSII